MWFSGRFFPLSCSLDTVHRLRVAGALRDSVRILFFLPFRPSQRLLWASLQDALGPVSGTGFGALVYAACFAGPALLSKVCRSLSLASVLSAMRFFGFLICHPLSVARFGVGLSGSVFGLTLRGSSFVTVCLQCCSWGLGFCPDFSRVCLGLLASGSLGLL